MPLKWTCTPTGSLLMVDDPSSFISFTPMEGVRPENVNIRWMFTADIDGRIPVDDAQLRVVAHVTANTPEGSARASVEVPPYETIGLAGLAQEGLGLRQYSGLQLTLRVEAPGPDTCQRAEPMPTILRVFWNTNQGDAPGTAPWQLVWTRKELRRERRVLALGLDMGTSSDSVSAIVQQKESPAVLYLLEDSVGDNIGRLSFVPEERVGPQYRNPDSDIVAMTWWSRFGDRELAMTVPEHTLRVMSAAHREPSGGNLFLLRRLKACIQFFQENMKIADRWPYSGLSVANLINRIRHAAPLAPCAVHPGVHAHLTFSFSFAYNAVCQLAQSVKMYCESAVPAIAIPEGQATGLAFIARAIRRYGAAAEGGEHQIDAVRKAFCRAFGLPLGRQAQFERALIISHDVGDGTAEACLQTVVTGDDPEARKEGVQDRALIRSTASLYWAEPFGGGGRVTVMTRTLFVLRLLLRIFDRCADGQQFYDKLDRLMPAFGFSGESQPRPKLPIGRGELMEIWPLVLAVAERTLVGDPDINVSVAPNVEYFRRLAERRGRCVREPGKQFLTYVVHMPEDVASLRAFVDDFARESLAERENRPAYVAAAQRLLAADNETAGERVEHAAAVARWMVNGLFDFAPDPRDTLDESRFRRCLSAALWEVAEQYKCQFPRPVPLRPHREWSGPAGEERIAEEEDAIRDPEWQYEAMGERAAFEPRIRHEKWFLFENLAEELANPESPGAALMDVLPEEERPRVDGSDFHAQLAKLLTVPPLAMFRHTVAPTYVMLHNAFGLFEQAGEEVSPDTPRLFIPSGRGTAFAVYQYLLNTYVLAHYGSDLLVQAVPTQRRTGYGAGARTPAAPLAGRVPIIRFSADDPIALKHSQVDGALCSILLERAAPIAVRVEHGTEPARYFPYTVRIEEKGGEEAEVREHELLTPGPWRAPVEKEYANPDKRFLSASGGERRIKLVAGYDSVVKTSMTFASEPMPQTFVGTEVSFQAAGTRRLPEYHGSTPDAPENAQIAVAYRDLVPPEIVVYCQGPDAKPRTFTFSPHETIKLSGIFMEHETALLR